MPQIEQLPYIFFSQLFWLAVVFGIHLLCHRQGDASEDPVDGRAREKKIADDLEGAQQARAAAEETEAAWRARMDASRAEAAKVAQEARQDSARETEAKVRKAADKINAKVEAAEQQIRDAVAGCPRGDRSGRRRSDPGNGRSADRHQGRQEGSRRGGKGGTPWLSSIRALATVEHEGGAAHEAPNFLWARAPWFIALAIVCRFCDPDLEEGARRRSARRWTRRSRMIRDSSRRRRRSARKPKR